MDRPQRRLAAIVALDIVGYSRLMSFDEEGTLNKWNSLRTQNIDPLIADHSGRTVKLMGDGALIEFASVVDAVECAVAIQRSMTEREPKEETDRKMSLRIGVNLGDIIIEGGDIFGDGVNVAARLEALAEPDGICISAAVRDQVGDRISISYADLGDQQLKNIAKPVRVYSVVLNASARDLIAQVQPELPNKPSIAVLPFTNVGGSEDHAVLADGISEDLIAGLATLKWLFVIARSSTDEYKSKFHLFGLAPPSSRRDRFSANIYE